RSDWLPRRPRQAAVLQVRPLPDRRALPDRGPPRRLRPRRQPGRGGVTPPARLQGLLRASPRSLFDASLRNAAWAGVLKSFLSLKGHKELAALAPLAPETAAARAVAGALPGKTGPLP